jgi:hypothetical protein
VTLCLSRDDVTLLDSCLSEFERSIERSSRSMKHNVSVADRCVANAGHDR